MSPAEIRVLGAPTAEDREAILALLRRFNEAHAGPSDSRPVAITLTDEAGVVLGGLWGKISYRWLFVEILCVADALRQEGYGSRLLARAEELAREAGCLGIWLDTFSFQAPDFYQRHGFEAFGRIGNYPEGRERIFFRKHLVPPPAD